MCLLSGFSRLPVAEFRSETAAKNGIFSAFCGNFGSDEAGAGETRRGGGVIILCLQRPQGAHGGLLLLIVSNITCLLTSLTFLECAEDGGVSGAPQDTRSLGHGSVRQPSLLSFVAYRRSV